MSSSKYAAVLIACLILPGAITGCEVSIESETPLVEDSGGDATTVPDTTTDPDTTIDPDIGNQDTGPADTDVADSTDPADTADSGDTDDQDTPDATLTEAEMVERGDYLVNHVAICVDCHTPRTQTGQLDESMLLAGNDCFVDYSGDPTDGVGCVSALNLTNHETGLKQYNDDQVFELLRTGATMHEGDKRILLPIMPYWTFANMTDSDLHSMIAYLRTLPPVDNLPAANEPLPGPFAIIEQRTEPALPVGIEEYPDSSLQPGDEGYEQAQHGKYMVAAGGCMDCHTPETIPPQDDPNSDWVPADRSRVLQGGREFPVGPDRVTSTNLTPHTTGIWDYTPEEIRIALKAGKDSENRQMCPPMPGGPESPYGGMTDEDALAIGWYLTTIPPKDNTVPECNK
jgi:mono/diheme cytochrome c family protein